MKKTILREFLIYINVSTLIFSLILTIFAVSFQIRNLKKELFVTSQILSENIPENFNENTNFNENILKFLSNEKIQINIFKNDKTPINNKIFSLVKYELSRQFQVDGFTIKLTGNINIILTYFYITLTLFIINYIFSIFYIKKLRKNVIFPLLTLGKENNFKYKLDEIENANSRIKTNKNKLEKKISNLQIENEKNSYILDNMSEGFMLIDKNLKVLNINKSAKKILNSRETAGKNIFHYTQNLKIIKPIETAIKENKNNNFDIILKNKKIYSTYVDKIKKENSKNYEYIVFMVDVTIKRQNEMLKQELFSNISHELKTPIASIKGYSELLQNGFVTSEDQINEFLSRIEKETFNINQLINDILTISKLENKIQNLDTTDIDVYSLVDEISKSLMPICIEKNIIIENNCEKINIKANYKDFYKLFNNLILNAIKYNNENGYVKVSFKKQNDYFELIVKDSGVGISAEDKNRIFERFYRVKKGRNHVSGSGLGLSIVKYIVRLYNGKIKVKSSLGTGSTFYIRFPKNVLV